MKIARGRRLFRFLFSFGRVRVLLFHIAFGPIIAARVLATQTLASAESVGTIRTLRRTSEPFIALLRAIPAPQAEAAYDAVHLGVSGDRGFVGRNDSSTLGNPRAELLVQTDDLEKMPRL